MEDFIVYKQKTKEEGNVYWYHHDENFLTKMNVDKSKELANGCPNIKCVFKKQFGDNLKIVIKSYDEFINKQN